MEGIGGAGLGQVGAFAAHTAQDVDRRVAVLRKGVAAGSTDIRPRYAADVASAAAGPADVGTAVVNGGIVSFRTFTAPVAGVGGGVPGGGILLDQGGVYHQARAFKSGVEAGGLAGIHRTGTGASVDRIDGGDAEDAHLVAGSQGQGFVFVLQQHRAFSHDFFGHAGAGANQVFQFVEIGLVILRIVLGRFGIDFHLKGSDAQSAVDHGHVLHGYHLA